MKITREWFKAFNVSEEQVESWFKEARSGENFTFWCLENKKIDKNKYLQWAKEHYKLPIIKPQFFENLAETPWWSIVSSVSNWSERFLPIAEWDNTIFIACVEPKEGTHWSFPVQFLLTGPENLKKWWEHLNSNLTSTPQLDKNSQPQFTQPVTQSVGQPVTQPVVQPITQLAVSPSPTPVLEMPPPPQNLDSPTQNLTTTQQHFEAPEGFEMPLGLEAPEGFSLDPQSLPPTQQRQPPIQPQPQQVIVVMPAASAQAPSEQTNQSQQPKPEAIQSSAQPDLLANSEFSNLVSEAYTNYESIMVLMFEEDCLRPWVHDGKWTSKDSTAHEAIKIQQPCIFKIVKASAQPFHGPVSQNEINDSFFQKWNFPQSPAFVTLTPIKYDSYIAGMVLAVGSEEKSNSLLALEKMESLTESIKPFIESFNRAA